VLLFVAKTVSVYAAATPRRAEIELLRQRRSVRPGCLRSGDAYDERAAVVENVVVFAGDCGAHSVDPQAPLVARISRILRGLGARN
jgi:hypothetical protein